MPEEINRIVTDRLSDLLFVSEPIGVTNLQNEGVPDEKIFLCGNIMIDALMQNIKVADNSDILNQLSLEKQDYIAMTLHRPSNVDDNFRLKRLMQAINELSKKIKVVFPCHPRTVTKIKELGIITNSNKAELLLIEPLGYLNFLKLISEARLVISDSGGIQADTTYLKVPCLTIRNRTEQPATIEYGTNRLCDNPDDIIPTVDKIISNDVKKTSLPGLWDGHTANRIVNFLKESFPG